MAGATAPTAVPSERISAFQRDGFVVVPDLLSPDELDRYGRHRGGGAHRRTRLPIAWPRPAGDLPVPP